MKSIFQILILLLSFNGFGSVAGLLVAKPWTHKFNEGGEFGACLYSHIFFGPKKKS